MSLKLKIKEYGSNDWKPWERLGLLEGLEDNQKVEMGILFSKLFKFLHNIEVMMDGDISPKYDGFSGVVILIFPAMRRIYAGTNDPNIDIEYVYHELNDFYVKNRDEYMKKSRLEMDGEADMCADFSNLIINKLKKQ